MAAERNTAPGRTRGGRPEAAAAVWRGHARDEAEAVEPLGRKRLRGLLQGLAGAAVGLALFHFWSRTMALVAMAIAAIVGLSALVSPAGIYGAIERLFLAVGRFTGRLLTSVLIASIFYLVFLPFGLLFRRGARDRMQRFTDPEAPSYWEARDPDMRRSHERQY